jgi:flotillin
VQARRTELEVERLRSEQLAQAVVAAEARVKAAEADAAATRLGADAAFHAAAREADGTRAKYEALAEGLTRVRGSLGQGDQAAAALAYLMIERGVYEKLAAANAEAVRGMNPKITVWSTGDAGAAAGSGGGGGGGMAAANPLAAIANLYRALPPIATTIEEQTGIRPPTWLMQMPPAGSGGAPAGDAAKPQPELR